jgi:triacylglycerol lipase
MLQKKYCTSIQMGIGCVVLIFLLNACNTKKTAGFITSKELVVFNQLMYKDSIGKNLSKVMPTYKVVWQPKAINGNYAVVLKNIQEEKYCLLIRGSMIDFSETGFHNWILQDFNIFTFKDWTYVDTVKKAAISSGSNNGFENLLQLKDTVTQKSLESFLIENITATSSLIVTGHSLGGNLAQVYASYLWKKMDATQQKHINIVTFGATAVGNKYFVQDLEEKFPLGERYEIDKDIAPKFPSMDKVGKVSAILGVDSLLGINKNAEGSTTQVINLIGAVAESFNIMNEKNSFVQSIKHERLLTVMNKNTKPTETIGLLNLIDEVYFYHKIDQYANNFGVMPIDSALHK